MVDPQIDHPVPWHNLSPFAMPRCFDCPMLLREDYGSTDGICARCIECAKQWANSRDAQ